MLFPHQRAPAWPSITPGRFASTIRTESSDGCAIALLGLPDDLGVKLNHGRPGAAEGPRTFRAALARFGASFDAARGAALDVPVFDAGDVEPAPGDDADALRATHERITTAALALRERGLVTIGVGGGHDLTFPTVRALSQSVGSAVGGVNVDPHLDVREETGSGMPFRSLIEGGFLDPKRFTELGAGRFSNAASHAEWVRGVGANIIVSDDVIEHHRVPGEGPVEFAFRAAMPNAGASAFVSIDLDVIDGSQAPGVSAVNPSGLPVHLVCEIARLAGAEPRVRHFDIMELSPPHDDPPDNGRTARIAALIFLHFIAGFTERPERSA